MRLDVYLFESGLVASRTEAKGFISSGAVTVNGVAVNKPAYSIIPEKDIVAVDKSSKRYVSRGGLKLEAALTAFSIDVSGARAVDIGASSGGFTDCLLKAGAEHVVAIDSGTAQLSGSLRGLASVTSIENYNARFMKSSDLPYIPDIAVMDVSFISATYIIPAIYDCLAPGGVFICLIKPQFEVGRSAIGKGGIVKDKRAREEALSRVIEMAKQTGFEFCGSIISPIMGGDGNIEYLAHFIKDGDEK